MIPREIGASENFFIEDALYKFTFSFDLMSQSGLYRTDAV